MTGCVGCRLTKPTIYILATIRLVRVVCVIVSVGAPTRHPLCFSFLQQLGRWLYPMVPEYDFSGRGTASYTQHPSNIYIAQSAKLSRRVTLQRDVLIGTKSVVEDGAVLMNCTIGARCKIGKNTKVCVHSPPPPSNKAKMAHSHVSTETTKNTPSSSFRVLTVFRPLLFVHQGNSAICTIEHSAVVQLRYFPHFDCSVARRSPTPAFGTTSPWETAVFWIRVSHAAKLRL